MRSVTLFFVSFSISCMAMEVRSRSIYGDMKNMTIDVLNTYIKNIHTDERVFLPHDYNLLHLAAILKAPNQADIIIQAKKYDINQHDNQKSFTPLYIACNENDSRMVHLLLNCGANPNIATQKGMTPLLKAILKENITIISLLLLHNADVNQKNCDGDDSPLHAAIRIGNSTIVNLLLHHYASVNLDLEYCFTPLMAAAQMDVTCKDEKTHCLRIVKALLDAKANHAVAYREDQDTALHIAVGRWNKDVVYLLLKAGADPNAVNTDRETPLHIVLQNIKNATLLDYTTLKKSCAIAQLLLLFGAELSQKQLNKNINLNAILKAAIDTGTSELVKFSLVAGANANYKNSFGDTPLHLLAQRKSGKRSLSIAMLLLKYGADLKLVDAEKRNVLDVLLQERCQHIGKK